MMLSNKVQFLSLVALAIVLSMGDVATAQRGGWGQRTVSVKDLLRNESVKKELEISEDQASEIKLIEEEEAEERREMFMDMRADFQDPNADRGELMTKARDGMARLGKKTEDAIGGVLLAHQMSRVRQIAMQQNMQKDPEAAVKALMEEIGADEEQLVKFKEARAKGTKELREKIPKLQRQALDKALSAAFRPEQVRKIKDKLGESFAMEQQQQAFRGWGGQQRGGGDRGGDRGDRGGDRGDRGGDRGERGRGNDF